MSNVQRQDEGGLPAALTSSTTSALAAIAKTIGARRVAAVASNASNAPHASSDAVTHGAQYGAGVTALQDCFIFVRRAVLETAKAALQVRQGNGAACMYGAASVWSAWIINLKKNTAL